MKGKLVDLGQGCRNPVLEDCDPAGFSGRNEVRTRVKAFSTWKIRKPGGGMALED